MRRELTLLAVVLLATSCGGHARPRVAGYYLAYNTRYQTAGEPPVVLARADGKSAHTIAHGEDPAVSPDGRWVALDVPSEPAGVDKLFIVSTRGGKPRLVARTSSLPVWSPSSDRIVTFNANELLASIDLRGHVTVLDTDPTAGSDGWSFSPDGRWVAYDAERGTDCGNLYIERVVGGDRRLVMHGAGGPVWGKHWIAVVTEDGCARPAGIWRIRPNGTGLHLILPEPRRPGRNGIYGFYPVAWASDERALLGNIASPDAWNVAIRIDVATGRYRRLFGYAVDISRDGRFALVQVGPGGGLHTQVSPQKILAFPFGRHGRVRVLGRGQLCCPSWNR